MAALDKTPANKNFLNPLNFKFQIQRAPNVNFFIQKINIPSITLPEIEVPTPFVNIPVPQTNMVFGMLDITFKVDEDLQNYLEIHNWIRSLGTPYSLGLEPKYPNLSYMNSTVEAQNVGSEITLTILNELKHPTYQFVFHRAFPISLSEIVFDTTDDDVNYVSASASFKYILFDVDTVGA